MEAVNTAWVNHEHSYVHQSEFSHNVPLFEHSLLEQLSSCHWLFISFFDFTGQGMKGQFFSFQPALGIAIIALVEQLIKQEGLKWKSARQFIVVLCLQVDELEQLWGHREAWAGSVLCALWQAASFQQHWFTMTWKIMPDWFHWQTWSLTLFCSSADYWLFWDSQNLPCFKYHVGPHLAQIFNTAAYFRSRWRTWRSLRLFNDKNKLFHAPSSWLWKHTQRA